jgi:hypothetical protein
MKHTTYTLSPRSFKNFQVGVLFSHLNEFLHVYRNYFQVELCVPPITLKNLPKHIFMLLCSILAMS